MPILTDDERIGTLLAGKYRVRRLLARGGMGVLFEGEHSWTGRSVAIKLLHPSATADATVAQRFLREGRAATALHHPHVVDVLDMGQADDGALFMVLELLQGVDLAQARHARGPLDARAAIELVSPIIDALAAAHAMGIVHRDIKPSNVFLARQADASVLPTLLDFGIAKALGEGDSHGTKSGIIVGTPHYMSPEQAEGVDEVGPPTDTWALGVLLYELVSGSLPYDGGSPTAILMAILQKPHLPLHDVAPSVPPAVATVIEMALARHPAARPRDLRVWAAQLRSAAGLPPLTMPLVSAVTLSSTPADFAAPTGTLPTDPPPAPRAPAPLRPTRAAAPWYALGAALLVVTLAIGVFVAWRSRSTEPVARPLEPTAPVVVAPPPTPIAASPEPIAPPASEPSPDTEASTSGTPPPPASHASRPTRPVRVPSGASGSGGRRPITTITTEW